MTLLRVYVCLSLWLNFWSCVPGVAMKADSTLTLLFFHRAIAGSYGPVTRQWDINMSGKALIGIYLALIVRSNG